MRAEWTADRRGPALQRHRESVPQRILGEIEISHEADQGRQRPARLVAKDFSISTGSSGFYRFEPGMAASSSVQ
jgi:hypothetical protein